MQNIILFYYVYHHNQNAIHFWWHHLYHSATKNFECDISSFWSFISRCCILESIVHNIILFYYIYHHILAYCTSAICILIYINHKAGYKCSETWAPRNVNMTLLWQFIVLLLVADNFLSISLRMILNHKASISTQLFENFTPCRFILSI